MATVPELEPERFEVRDAAGIKGSLERNGYVRRLAPLSLAVAPVALARPT